MRSHLVSSLALLVLVTVNVKARADNAIQIENAKPVDAARDSWLPKLDSTTYEATDVAINGTIDGYPSSWSVKNGDVLGLRVSTTAAKFRTRIYRIGWYANSPTGPVGSRLVHEVAETSGQKQPFPAENGETGLAEAKWTDSVTVKIPNDWVTGHYVVRFTTDAGKEGFTYFIVRDDTAATKAPILFTDTLATAFAYNPWPKIFDASGKQVSGKSTYSYNSMGVDVKASGAKQAVEVSFDRPHGENWGLGIWRDWTVPTVQFLEKHGIDVAYADSLDLDTGYVLGARKMWMDSGHDEYWTASMWDHLEDARDKGLNLAWFSGNDLTWQVRLKPGSGGPRSTMVAYKISAYPDTGRCGSCWEWGGDPEYKLALEAKKAGRAAEHLEHLKRVTYAWAGLKDWDPDAPSPTFPAPHKGAPITPSKQVSRLAISFEGLMNGPKLPFCPATAGPDHACRGIPWIVDNADHWIFTGVGVKGGKATGLKNGDRIPMIVGYEMDNARLDKVYTSRPATQVVLGHTDAVFTPEKGSATDFSGLFNAQYYQHKSGAHVFSAGLINWFWGVEREGMGNWGSLQLKATVRDSITLEQAMTAMTLNVLAKFQDGPGIPPTTLPDGGPLPPDDVPLMDGGVAGQPTGDAVSGGNASSADTSGGGSGCGCTTAGEHRGVGASMIAAGLALGAWVARRRRTARVSQRPSGNGVP